MKKSLLVVSAFAALAMACEPVKEIPVVDVTMSYFAFKAENNPSLKTDYVVENPETSFHITFPYGTDEAAIKSLVPVFTVTEDAVVTVNEVEVESGVTPLDFSYPVEFLVTVNEKSNAQYTVKVDIAGPASFSLAARGEVADSLTKGPYMAISPKDNMPYFGVCVDAAASTDYNPALYKYDGAAISKVCTVAATRGDQPVVAFSPEGDAFFSFYDYTGKFANVYAISGSAATAVGPTNLLYRPLTSSYYSTMGLAPLSSSNVYLAYGVNAASGSLAKRELNLCNWNGSAWTQEMGIAGRDAKNYAYEVFSKMVGDDYYMLVFNQNIHTLSLYKFNAAGVSTVFESLGFKQPLDPAADAKVNLYGLGFDIASDGTPYILCLPENGSSTGSTYSPAVYKFNSSDSTFSLVGGVLSDVDGQAGRYVAMALDGNDIPYLTYVQDKKAYYTYVDAKTKIWVTPVLLSDEETTNLSIDFSADGVGYISCAVASGKNSYAVLYSTK